MIKYCLKKWDANKDKLEQFYRKTKGWNECNYLDIVMAVVTHVLNDSEKDYENWNIDGITEIDNGDYQGTLLYLIPQKTYQPSEYDYLITYVYYGSCAGCDTLLAIQDNGEGQYLTEEQVKDFMTLSKDVILHMKKLYNTGWRREEEFDEVVYE